MYDIKYVKGHVEVYLNGKLMFTADTYAEALTEISRDDMP